MNHSTKIILACLIALWLLPAAALAQCPSGNTLFVKADAVGNGDGTSWTDAFTDLQSALASTCPGITEIWVAAGTYKPSAHPTPCTGCSGSRDYTFQLTDGISLYGGFAGTETLLSQRDIAANTTTLSGDIGAIGNASDNVHHVVVAALSSTASTTRLNGFTVTGGNADVNSFITMNGAQVFRRFGGGIYTNNGTNTLANNTLSGNSAFNGGGIYTNNGTNTLANNTLSGNSATFGSGIYTNKGTNTLANNTLSGNSAFNGGGIYTFQGTNMLTSNTLSGNSANFGGGIYLDATTPQSSNNILSNNILSGNSATGNGGGIYIIQGTNTLINNTLSENSATLAGGIYTRFGTNTLVNNIIWGNSSPLSNENSALTVTHSIVKGGYPPCINCPGTDGNIDPLFVSTTDFRLQPCSPAIDAGDDGANTTATDLDGNDRAFEAIPGDPTIDLGAYEFQTTLAIGTYYADTDGDDYGTGTGQDFCEDPGTGWALQAGDCDDNDPNINPGAPEVCDGIDNNCIDGIDENDICCPSGNILYVNDDASGNNDGSSWADAFNDLQDALALTCPGITQIWVAEGTYTPGTARTDAFVMKNNLAIYGGFPNTGNPGFGDRNEDPATNGTVLSGEIGGAGNTDNSYHIILNDDNGLNTTALLDGFTLTGGNADNGSNFTDDRTNGGGMFNRNSSPQVINCTFSENRAKFFGGGMYNQGFSSPTVTNCTFSGNSVDFDGGGMHNNESSSPTVTSCTFSGNSAIFLGGAIFNKGFSLPTVTNCTFSVNSALRGGGIYDQGSYTTLMNCSFLGNTATSGGAINSNGSTMVNCTFSGNLASTEGGGIYNNSGSATTPTVINSTFSGNSAPQGGAIFNAFSSPLTVTNCILWGNSSEITNGSGNPIVTYSVVQGGYQGTGNLNVDPLFVSQPPIGLGITGDLRLQACSPAIDAGDDSANTTATDLDGNDRTFEAIPGAPTIDLGAYEYQATLTITTYYADTDGDDYGTGTGQDFCAGPGTGWALQAGDCDDNDPNINPGAPEVCDGIDNNCIDGIDENDICCPSGNILYVNDDASGNNDGSSWADAFNDLQDALALTCPGITEIWVAAGTYKPSAHPTPCTGCSGSRDYTFQLTDGISLYGGFAGTETLLSQRDIAANTTTLSGDIGAIGNASDNVHHVVVAAFSSTAPTTRLDGFTVTGGNANFGSEITVNGAPVFRRLGGGIFTNNGTNTLANNILSGNSADGGGGGVFTLLGTNALTNNTLSGNSAEQGGGIHTDGGTNTLTNNTLSGNSAFNGGGIYTNNGTNTLANNTLSGNSAFNGGGIYTFQGTNTLTSNTLSGNSANFFGGGIYLGATTPQSSNNILSNNILSGNSATGNGGGIYINNGTNTLINNTLSENSATLGGGIYTRFGANTLVNNIIWGNSSALSNENSALTVTHSIVKGGYPPCINCPGTDGNIDPLFVSTTDFRLQPCSPAIDAGSNAALPAGVTTDLDGNPRFFDNGTVDMGAYELQSLALAGTVLYVDADATGANTGVSWAHAFTKLQDALASDCAGVTEIWVAAGTYYPDEGVAVTDDDRFASFVLQNGLALYGGFAGTETQRSEGDWETNVTVLSGDLQQNDSQQPIITDITTVTGTADNAYTVVTGSNTDNTAVIDGFTVTAGQADGASTLIDNTGGGFFIQSGSPTLTNLSITGNSADFGGGMYNNISSSPTLTNVTISGNNAATGGGMINVGSSPTLTNVSISGNSADFGGGMYNANNSSPTLTNVVISGNSASSGGGGMYNWDSSSPTLTNVVISGNSAGLDGGGMYNSVSSSPTLTNVTILGNIANNGAGGIFNVSSSSPTLTNVTISGNSAGSIGGGMYNFISSSPTLTNVSISGNSAGSTGGGMYNASSSPALTNTIIWDNSEDGSTTTAGASISNFISSTPQITNSLIANSGGSDSWDTAIGTDGGGNIDMDPLFVTGINPADAPTTAGDFRLQACSPAIDAGSNAALPAGVTTDLDGNPRFFNSGTVDMGAYEYQDIPVTAPTGALAITNSTCSDCSLSGSSIAIGTVSIMGGTLEYSTDNGMNWSSALPAYNQDGPAQTILASALASGGCRSNSTQVGVTAPGECVTPAAPTGALAITNSTCSDCSLSGGSIAIGTVSIMGGTLEYSTDNGATWNSILPTYNQDGPAQTILASVLSANGCRSGSAQVGVTVPGECQTVVASCQNQAASLGVDGNASLPASALNGASSGCSGLTFSVNNANTLNFDCADIGNNTVTLTVTDIIGQTSTCSATVTVSDPNTPVAQCDDITIQLSPNGMTTISPADIGAGSEVACGAQTETLSKATFDCFDIGPNTVTYTVTGTNGESDQCTAVVTVIAGGGLPAPYQSADIGQSNSGNDYAYRPCEGQFSITSTAQNPVSGAADSEGFISVELCGDFTFEARLDSLTGDSGYGGLMARESNSPGAKQASLFSNRTSLLRWEQRAVTNGPKQTTLYDRAVHTYLRLVRSGDMVSGYSSNTGSTYQLANSATVGMAGCLQVGITAFTNDPSGETHVVFSGVQFDGTVNDCPAAPLVLNGSPIAGGTYRSAATITSAGAVLPSTEVLFTAGESITLQPGFSAAAGATFTARIEDCLPPSGNALWGGATAEKGQKDHEDSAEVDYRTAMGQVSGRGELNVFPNPFRNQTTVALSLSEDRPVSLRLFDLTGKLVSTVLPPAIQPAGAHQYRVDGSRLAPGVYILAVQIGEVVQQRRLVVVR